MDSIMICGIETFATRVYIRIWSVQVYIASIVIVWCNYENTYDSYQQGFW